MLLGVLYVTLDEKLIINMLYLLCVLFHLEFKDNVWCPFENWMHSPPWYRSPSLVYNTFSNNKCIKKQVCWLLLVIMLCVLHCREKKFVEYLCSFLWCKFQETESFFYFFTSYHFSYYSEFLWWYSNIFSVRFHMYLYKYFFNISSIICFQNVL